MTARIPSVLSLARNAVITVTAATVLAGCGAAASSTDQSSGGPTGAVAVAVTPVAHQLSPASPQARGGIWSGRVRAYGDSVMLGAKYALQHRVRAKVYAAESRQCGAVVGRVRKAARRGNIHGPVVIHTGTNGTVRGCHLRSTVKKLQRHHAVVLVNVRAARSWTGPNNHLLARIDRKWKNVVLLDWHALAGRHPGWLYSDGIHLTPSGRVGYAKAVKRLLHR